MKITEERTSVGVLGAGAWGTALAIHAARMGHTTLIWGRDAETIDSINGPERVNQRYLPGHPCPPGLLATLDPSEVVRKSEIILVVVPTPFIPDNLAPLRELLTQDKILVGCSKGILNETLETVDEIMEHAVPEAFRSRLAYLSGPSFAAEVAQGQPTVVTIASKNKEVAARVQHMFSTPSFRCYRTTDVTGVEMGGALKNVLAIACGMADGMGMGHNARAALITRGLNELTRLAVAKGGNPLTMGGLAGVGDLVLTCTGDLSRNRTVGLRLGRGETLTQIRSSMSAVAEGVLTSRAAHNLAQKLGVSAPILSGIYRVIHEGADLKQEIHRIMTRDLTEEVDYDVMASAAAAAMPSGGEGMKSIEQLNEVSLSLVGV